MPVPKDYRLKIKMQPASGGRYVLSIVNENPFRVLDLRLRVQSPEGEKIFDIGSIDRNGCRRMDDDAPFYTSFVPAAFYEGKAQAVNPTLWDEKRGLYSGSPHHALVWPRQDTETDWLRSVTAAFPKQHVKAELTFPALGPRIAFSGHSFTGLWDSSYYYLRELAVAGGWNAQIAYDYWGGTGLAHHAGLVAGCEQRAEQTNMLLNANEYYDFYVVAGNSDEAIAVSSDPSDKPYFTQRERMMRGAQILYEKAKQKSARMLLWATQPYKYGFFQNIHVKPWQKGRRGDVFVRDGKRYVCTLTRDEMALEVENFYRMLARRLGDGTVAAPVGRAYALLYGRYGEQADPYQPCGMECGDNGHQNNLGNFLAACVLYGLIFGESPEGLPVAVSHTAGMGGKVTPQQALWAQQIAWEAVTDSSAYPPCCG